MPSGVERGEFAFPSLPLWLEGGEPRESLRAPGRSAGGRGHHQGSLSGLTASSLWRVPRGWRQSLARGRTAPLESRRAEGTEGCATGLGWLCWALPRLCQRTGLCQNGEGEKDVNQSSTEVLSCFMCWRNRVPTGWQVDVLVSVHVPWVCLCCVQGCRGQGQRGEGVPAGSGRGEDVLEDRWSRYLCPRGLCSVD